MSFITRYRFWGILFLLLVLHVFFRFYDLENRTPFGWDQIDNAWVAKDILVDHRFPLVGMQVKQNSGFFIGPAYYYFIVPFYALFDLDPIAAGVIAGVTSIITFFVIFYLTKKIFSMNVALIATFLYVVSYEIIRVDRLQWPVNFIPAISFIIFYSLYKIIMGNNRYLFILAIALGLSFHINFTSIFFPILVFLSLPLFPRTKKMLRYAIFSLPLFLIWFVQNILAEFTSGTTFTPKNVFGYLDAYYHGFHLRRVLQLTNDAFIEFGNVLWLPILRGLRLLILPLFILVFLRQNFSRDRRVFVYLAAIWIIVPWLILSTYSGEITEYYFSITRPIALIIIAYLIFWLLNKNLLVVKILVIIFLFYYGFVNSTYFLQSKIQGLGYYRKKALKAIKEDRVIEFRQGVPEAYIYYYYTEHKRQEK